MWHVYILKTKNDQLYTGITNNVDRRMKQHRTAKGARFTRIFGFAELLYVEEQPNRSDALKRERQIKRWPRDKKMLLVSSKELIVVVDTK